jgi:hypothetical protein
MVSDIYQAVSIKEVIATKYVSWKPTIAKYTIIVRTETSPMESVKTTPSIALGLVPEANAL